jgi:orotidine-5'-phosphate decarboxylase
MEGRTKMILAIDPGNIESAYVVINDDLSIKEFGKIPNEEMLSTINAAYFYGKVKVVIEMIASYGMAVGKIIHRSSFYYRS